MEYHLKRFFIDVYQDSSMYEGYLKGAVLLDSEVYQKWYTKMEKRNYLFATNLKSINRPYPKDFVVESALNEDLTVTKKLYNKSETIVSDFGFPKLEQSFLDCISSDKKVHYICNGCFMNTLENISRVLERGSFSVGICCDKKIDLYRKTVDYYNQLKNILLNVGYQVSSFESYCPNNERVYLLRYDSIRGKAKK